MKTETIQSLAQETIECAEKLLPDAVMHASAAVCLSDAKHLQERGLYKYAAKRGLDCLLYIGGVFHPDYRRLNQRLMAQILGDQK